MQGLEALADRYDLVFCDVWGVLHDGIAAFPPAAEALQRYRSGRGRAVVLVSNAPRPGSVVADQLDSLGVPRSAYDTIVTSGDITRAVVAERGTEMVHHLGPERDMGLFDGLEVRFGPIDKADYVVCTGLFDDERETLADYEKTLRDMLGRNLWMVCANPDIVVERGDRLILCAGALAAAYEDMGGRSYTGGKPHRPIYETALKAGAEALGQRPVPGRMLGIGDAIRTDVAGARGFGIDALLIARGIHAAELGYATGQLERELAVSWLAQQAFQPTAMASELSWT